MIVFHDGDGITFDRCRVEEAFDAMVQLKTEWPKAYFIPEKEFYKRLKGEQE